MPKQTAPTCPTAPVPPLMLTPPFSPADEPQPLTGPRRLEPDWQLHRLLLCVVAYKRRTSSGGYTRAAPIAATRWSVRDDSVHRTRRCEGIWLNVGCAPRG